MLVHHALRAARVVDPQHPNRRVVDQYLVGGGIDFCGVLRPKDDRGGHDDRTHDGENHPFH